jgi:curved DNA-binding protein CbpA
VSSWLECCLILGVDEHHSAEELRSAYKLLALRHHPDKQSGGKDATKQFQELQHAYSFLTDPAKRRQFEQEFEAEDDDFFYDEEVMSFFFGPLGRGGGGVSGGGPCDCFHCSERKFEEMTCYHCQARGQKFGKCAECSVRLCGACVALHLPEDCVVVQQERVASFLPMSEPRAVRKSKNKKKKSTHTAPAIKRVDTSSDKQAALKKQQNEERQREAEKRDGVLRTQLESVAKQLHSERELSHLSFEKVLNAVHKVLLREREKKEILVSDKRTRLEERGK